ncbi:hypothetical protein, partial [Tatumella ptyseos]|uniref:hypothetical protein n=1 Tax=Tatumella ptyseos TaxID=82987 RepID=UPI001C26D69E
STDDTRKKLTCWDFPGSLSKSHLRFWSLADISGKYTSGQSYLRYQIISAGKAPDYESGGRCKKVD